MNHLLTRENKFSFLTPVQYCLLGFELLAFMAFWFHRSLINMYMAEIGGTPSSISLMESSYFFPSIFLTVLGGILADKPRRIVYLSIAILLFFMAQLSIAFLMLIKSETIIYFVFLTLTMGCMGALKNPMSSIIVKDFSSENSLSAMISGSVVSFNVARVLGPAIMGALVAFWSFGDLGIFAALLNVPMFIFLLAVKRNAEITEPHQPEGVIQHEKKNAFFFIAVGAFYLCSNLIWTILPFIFKNIGLDTTKYYGASYSIFGIAAALSGFIYPKLYRRIGLKWLMTLSALGYGLVYISALSPSPVLILFSLGVAGVAMSFFSSCVSSYILLNTQKGTGKKLSIAYTIMNGSLAIGSLLLSYVASNRGVYISAIITAVVLIVITPALVKKINLN